MLSYFSAPSISSVYLYCTMLFPWLYTICSIVAVLLSTKQNIRTWPLNASRKLLGLYIYYSQRLYVKCIVDLLLIFEGIYGWITWNKGKKDKTKRHSLQVSSLPARRLLLLGCFTLVACLLIGWGFDLIYIYTKVKKSHPYLDGSHSLLVLITYGLLAHKKREAWLFYCLANMIYLYIFGVLKPQEYSSWYLFFQSKEGALCVKYAIYLLLCFRAGYKWNQAYHAGQQQKEK